MKVAFLTGRYDAKELNVRYERHNIMMRVSKELLRMGFVVMCPYLDNSLKYARDYIPSFWKQSKLELVKRSDIIVRIQGWYKSRLAIQDSEYAQYLGKPYYTWPYDKEDIIKELD